MGMRRQYQTAAVPTARGVLSRTVLPVLLAAALILLDVSTSLASEAGTTGDEQRRLFVIPAQPLAAALQAFGQVAGVQLLYESKSAEGRQSTAIEGLYTPHEALIKLLAATDLKVQYSRPGALTLMLEAPAEADGAAPRFGSDLSLGTLHVQGATASTAPSQEFSEAVRMDVHNALRNNPRTRDGNYRAVVKLWINNERTVEQVDVATTSGDPTRDTALIAALRGLTMSRPQPPGMAQPVRIGVSVRTQ
ncbi:secretin/TonB short N-terminal domain-containing protein [Bradyrhizobium oligotrophicum S58]|uniref:Secretin/TonB short N-terminal domain-containing protein n=1 Tax=Bradyrhizobium oligotrophicum S58 TaxID=1245469 RepID=M4ZFG5_9BRAD|nr:secretin/TonB short N-terminal domain-containing protein [Bradyrhizobium oligotrophicum S58]